MTLGIILLALVLVVRLYTVQIVRGEAFAAKAEGQYIVKSTNLFERGAVYFRDKTGKELSAATLRSGYLLYVNPKNVTSPNEVCRALSDIAGEAIPLDCVEQVSDKTRTYRELANRLPDEVGKAIAEKDFEGVGVSRERWRYYPGDQIAAQTIGFVSFQGDTLTGSYGVERSYNQLLSRPQKALYANFFAEVFSNLGSVLIDPAGKRTGDLITTIDPSVQVMLERSLAETRIKWQSKEVGGIIMNPKTGEILAMAVAPTFDLNKYGEASPDLFKNPLVENVYEFGSIMKPLTIAVGIDTEVITPESTYYDAGVIHVDGRNIYNFDLKGRGTATMQDVLDNSLNTGVSHVVQEVGTERFANYFKKIFGGQTGIDLPNEGKPLIGNLSSPRTVEYYTASFGQGVAVSPVSMIRGLATLANKGVMPAPHVGYAVKTPQGISTELKHGDPVQVFSEQSAQTVSGMLTKVVDNALRGGATKREGYTVAAKTGTAQMALADGRGYYEDRYFHSFFGYFPATDPKIIILLYQTEPQGARYASETLTDTFDTLTTFLINHYAIPPDRSPV